MQNLSYSNTNTVREEMPPVFINIPKRQKQTEWEEAEQWLLETLAKSRKSAEEKGWISEEEADRIIANL